MTWVKCGKNGWVRHCWRGKNGWVRRGKRVLSGMGDSRGEELKRNREELHVEKKERRRIDTYERKR